MPISDDCPSETSPLLGPDGDGVAPKAVNGSIANGAVRDGAAEVGEDLERCDSIDESRAAQFKGQPEIRKQLKYIIPAVSIGVIQTSINKFDLANRIEGLFVCCRPNHHYLQLWQNWKRTWCTKSHQLDCYILLPDPVVVSTALWETQRHLWPKGMPALVLRHLRAGEFVLWPGSGHQPTDCRSSK